MNSFHHINKMMLFILLAHLPVFLLIQGIGEHSSFFLIVASFMLSAIVALSYTKLKEQQAFGYVVATALMINSAILIQSQLGQLEMHFHIFATMAFLLMYRSWKIVATGALVIAVHHLILTQMQLSEASFFDTPVMVYAQNCSWATFLIHAIFVVFEATAIGWMSYKLECEHHSSQSIINAIHNIQQQGDLNTRVKADKSNDNINSFNSLIEHFHSSFSVVSQSSDKLKDVSTSITDIAKNTKEGYSLQSDQTDQIATAVQELSYSIDDVAQNIGKISSDADEVKQRSASGLEVVNSSIKTSQQLQTEIASATTQIKKLQERCEDVGALVEVIRDISEQTNLLALNAAIEAARAGEMGRGFAVVADEVRGLAQRTNESTDRIKKQMDVLLADATSAVGAISQSSSLVNSNAEDVTKTGEMFNLIVGQIDAVANNNASVANSTEQQSLAVAEINKNVSELQSLVSGIEKQTDAIFNQSENLDQISQQTYQYVSKFTV